MKMIYYINKYLNSSHTSEQVVLHIWG